MTRDSRNVGNAVRHDSASSTAHLRFRERLARPAALTPKHSMLGGIFYSV
ncbi:MAG: hypothetical protein AAB367_00280 [Patescibacteria group bacterium]